MARRLLVLALLVLLLLAVGHMLAHVQSGDCALCAALAGGFLLLWAVLVLTGAKARFLAPAAVRGVRACPPVKTRGSRAPPGPRD